MSKTLLLDFDGVVLKNKVIEESRDIVEINRDYQEKFIIFIMWTKFIGIKRN